MASLTDKIKTHALALGFHKFGIARAEPLKEEGARLFQWLDAGYQGEMAWMQRWAEKRVDPSEILPNAKSVVVVALNYFTPHEHRSQPGSGKISRYAWGDDYHDIVREKLNELVDRVKDEEPGINARACVDTVPVMEKAWAVRAGLGWIGKSSNLITTDLGSWVFIGEIVVDIELDYDDGGVADHCGTCTACLDACPTGAIVEPYVVDGRKCISYATIELRDEVLPADFEGKMESWLYGCDICQDVCPWNRFEQPTDESRFEPRNQETELALDQVLQFSPEDYAARFRRSAMKRTKLTGLKRNARALKA
ncbi:MAG TPA: tRNA epoxyqueuosine(34) reductase QueG [Pyrinomonadaceae bacterium]